MILTRLFEYYQRLEVGGEVAPPGFQRKEIPFLVVIDARGRFKGLQDTRNELRGRGRSFLVPREITRSVASKANLLWDNPEYVFGLISQEGAKGQRRANERHRLFVERIEELPEHVRCDPGVSAVAAFLRARDFRALEKHSQWPEVRETRGNVSFQLEGDLGLVSERPAVRAGLAGLEKADGPVAQCLITGERDTVARLHGAIKGVRGAQSSGGRIVSFNLPAFLSHGRTQGENAPVGRRAEFGYTTALNTLLGRESRQKLAVGETTVVFWAARASPLEQWFVEYFGEEIETSQGAEADALNALYRAPETGAVPLDPGTPFYVLGLSPNAARLAVRFWYEGTVSEVLEKVRRYFEELAIVRSPRDPERPSLSRLLRAVAVQGDLRNIAPRLPAQLLHCALTGARYPLAVLAAVLARCRAEQFVTYPRAALLKAILTRNLKDFGPSGKEITMTLDRTNSSVAYRLGRLFAVLERVQEAALPGVGATIRERFYGAASTTPVIVFAHLMKLKNHHLAKLDRGRAIHYERLLGDVVAGIAEFPAHLTLADQGRFAIGYYHQRQDLFTAKSREEEAAHA
jgi:CRISPR-associated protein Csd1